MIPRSFVLQGMPAICGLFGTPYNGEECPACKGQREGAKRLVEQRFRQHGKEMDRLVRDVADRETPQ